MSSQLQINATARTETGKGQTRAVCREKHYVPAVVYGAGKDNTNIYLSAKDVMMLIDNPVFHRDVMTLTLDGKTQKVTMQAYQIHPNKGTVRHIDFLRVQK